MLKIRSLYALFSFLCLAVTSSQLYTQTHNLLQFSFSSRSSRLLSTGTGFAVSQDGFLITAHHVIKGADEVILKFPNTDPTSARLIAFDQVLDIALLRTTGLTPHFIPVSVGDPLLGEKVFTIGYPDPTVLGLNQKFTSGTISSLKGLNDTTYQMQISVPLQPGNSGGPLVSSKSGTVVGIVTSGANPLFTLKKRGYLPQNVNWATKSRYTFTNLGNHGRTNIAKTHSMPAALLTQNSTSVIKNNGSSVYDFFKQTKPDFDTKSSVGLTDNVSLATCIIFCRKFN